MPNYGDVAGYKVGTFVAGEYDHGPVNGLSGPVTAVMLSKGMLKSGGHVSADCCNMTFVEADFAAEVGSDAINDAKTDLDLLAGSAAFALSSRCPISCSPHRAVRTLEALRRTTIVGQASELPAPARDYVPAFAGPYFEAICEWLGMLRPGVLGHALYDLIQQRLPFERFGIFLNPGHLIHLDERVSSPIFADSALPIRSGMVLQTDVIPASKAYFSTRMEDGVAVADRALQHEIRERYPATWARCQTRRRFVEATLSVECPPEVLLLSDMACLVPPYLLRPNTVLALER